MAYKMWDTNFTRCIMLGSATVVRSRAQLEYIRGLIIAF
jgi:hypothetical protein